jgi:hypothetical protein
MVSKIIIAILMVLTMVSCTTRYVDRPVEVKTPVIMVINKPNRPVFAKNDTTTTYMIKVLEYTKILETLINEHNEAKHE